MSARRVRALSVHAGYVCQERGACCTAGWPIHVEVDRLQRIEAALQAGSLAPVRATSVPIELYRPADGPIEAVLGFDSTGCVFHHGSGTSRCEIHRSLGHGALPLACRQFPRVSVRDPRGYSVTLSHYCPTAAALLDDAGPLHVVDSPAAFPPNGEYVGLEATVLPPLLRPAMLFDWESWWEWERASIETISSMNALPSALSRIAVAVDRIERWTPADGALIDRVRDAFDIRSDPAVGPVRSSTSLSLVLDAVPDAVRPHPQTLARAATTPARLKNFVAAHAFANWTIHLGGGIRSWLRSIEVAYGLVAVDNLDVSAADLLLRHLVDPQRLAEQLS